MAEYLTSGLGQTESKPGRPASFWVALVLGVLLALSVLFNVILLVSLVASGLSMIEVDRQTRHEEHFVSGDASSPNKILVIPVYGTIFREAQTGFGSRRDVVDTVLDALEAATSDLKVKAIIIDVNSPGGGITECDLIYNEVQRFRKARPDVKIVASMSDIAASGGYYVSMTADRVVASPTTLTGSIGVIMGFLNLEGLSEKIGVKQVIFKSGAHKDMFSPSRPVTDQEAKIAQAIITEMYDRFTGIVASGRKNLEKAEIVKLADGRIYTGQQAKENGLVDELGDFKDAVEITKKLANLSTARVIKYKRRFTFLEIFEMTSQNLKPEIKLLPTSKILNADTPRIMYLWTMQ